MIKCPFCDLTSTHKIGIYSHLSWKHFRNQFAFMGIVLAFLFFILGTLLPTYSEDIEYTWDKYILNKEPKLAITIQTIYSLKNNEEILVNEEKKIDYLKQFISKGILPLNIRNENFVPINIEDYEDSYCSFLIFDRANEILTSEQAKKEFPHIEDKIEDYRLSFISIPSINESLACDNCLVYEIYGSNRGNRIIEVVNFKICFPDYLRIISHSDNVEQEGKSCIRIKRNDVIEKDNFLGKAILERKDKGEVFEIWDKKINILEGKYYSKNKELDISLNDAGRIVFASIPKCRFP